MKWFEDLQVFLSGKKTYLMAFGYAVDTFGVQLGWWSDAESRTVLEQVFTVFFLRQGIAKSGPVETALAVK